MEKTDTIKEKSEHYLKSFFNTINDAISTYLPILLSSFVLVTTAFLCFYFKSNFENYLKLVNIIIWPMTFLITGFFFRKVFTYLFLSMDQFNFFGIKGELKNAEDIINEKVNERILEIEKDTEREQENKKSEQLIKKYKSEAKTKGSNADTYLDLAVKENKRNIESQKRIQEMEKENLELRRFISNNGLSKNVDGGKIQEDIQGSGGEKLSASNNDF